jgi:hypothetical protein
LTPQTSSTTSTPSDRKDNVKQLQNELNEGFKESRDYPNIDVSLQLEARENYIYAQVKTP